MKQKRVEQSLRIAEFETRNVPKITHSTIFGDIKEKELLRKIYPVSKIMKIGAEYKSRGESLRGNETASFNQRYRNKIKDPLGDADSIVRTYSCGPRVRNNFLGSKSEKEGLIKAAIVI